MDENKLFHSRNQQDRESIRDYDKAVPPSVARDIAKDHIGKSVHFPSEPGWTPAARPNFVSDAAFPKPWGLDTFDRNGRLKKDPKDEPPKDPA